MSEIGLKSVLKALGGLLQIRDVKQAPSELDTTSVKVVAGLDPGMIGIEQHQLLVSGSIAGLSIWDWQGVGSDGSFTTASLNVPAGLWRTNAEREAVILGLRVEISFPGNAPIVAEDGALMELSEYRQAAGNPVSYIKQSSFRPAMVANRAQGQYIWSYPMWVKQGYAGSDPPGLLNPGLAMAACPIYIPAGSRWGLTMTYWTDPVTLRVFPAGTFCAIYASIVSCPKGMRPPGM